MCTTVQVNQRNYCYVNKILSMRFAGHNASDRPGDEEKNRPRNAVVPRGRKGCIRDASTSSSANIRMSIFNKITSAL